MRQASVKAVVDAIKGRGDAAVRKRVAVRKAYGRSRDVADGLADAEIWRRGRAVGRKVKAWEELRTTLEVGEMVQRKKEQSDATREREPRHGDDDVSTAGMIVFDSAFDDRDVLQRRMADGALG